MATRVGLFFFLIKWNKQAMKDFFSAVTITKKNMIAYENCSYNEQFLVINVLKNQFMIFFLILHITSILHAVALLSDASYGVEVNELG